VKNRFAALFSPHKPILVHKEKDILSSVFGIRFQMNFNGEKISGSGRDWFFVPRQSSVPRAFPKTRLVRKLCLRWEMLLEKIANSFWLKQLRLMQFSPG
jgi:hypothetical protein